MGGEKGRKKGTPSSVAEKKALSCAPSAPSSLEASLSLYASRLARLAPRLRPLPSALFLEGVAEKGSQGVTLDRVACDAAAKALALGSGRGGAAAAAEAFWPFAEKFYAASEALLSAPDSLCAFCGARRRLGCGEEGQWSLVVETELALRRRRRVVREPRLACASCRSVLDLPRLLALSAESAAAFRRNAFCAAPVAEAAAHFAAVNGNQDATAAARRSASDRAFEESLALAFALRLLSKELVWPSEGLEASSLETLLQRMQPPTATAALRVKREQPAGGATKRLKKKARPALK